MAENSKIEWTDNTANFWWGCFKVSDGCKNCYADTWASRWNKKIWGPAETTDRESKKSVWANVRKWNREAKETGQRKRVFCMSMGDFFEDHPQVTEIRDKALTLISECRYLDWQILTKRPENVNRMIEGSRSHSFSDSEMWFYANPHVWIGTSVENQEQFNKRWLHLIDIPASKRFLSMEPLLGDVDLDLFGSRNIHDDKQNFQWVDWVIVGGESGPNARPMHPDWVRSIRDQCVSTGVPFFFKQWGEWLPNAVEYGCYQSEANYNTRHITIGGTYMNDVAMARVGKKQAGRLLDGRKWNQFPQTKQES